MDQTCEAGRRNEDTQSYEYTKTCRCFIAGSVTSGRTRHIQGTKTLKVRVRHCARTCSRRTTARGFRVARCVCTCAATPRHVAATRSHPRCVASILSSTPLGTGHARRAAPLGLPQPWQLVLPAPRVREPNRHTDAVPGPICDPAPASSCLVCDGIHPLATSIL